MKKWEQPAEAWHTHREPHRKILISGKGERDGTGQDRTGRALLSALLAYLSGMGLWFGRLEEGVWQFPHPHGHGGGHDGVFRVHHGVEKRLQVRLGVAPDVDDLVSSRRVVLARIHCPHTRSKITCPEKKVEKNSEPIPKLFSSSLSSRGKSRRHSEKVPIPTHPKKKFHTRILGLFFSPVQSVFVSCGNVQRQTAFCCCFLLAYL